MEETLLRVGKDPVFRKNWEDVVLEGNAFERMFTGTHTSLDHIRSTEYF